MEGLQVAEFPAECVQGLECFLYFAMHGDGAVPHFGMVTRDGLVSANVGRSPGQARGYVGTVTAFVS